VSGATTTPEQIRSFSKALLRDLRALERMLAEGRIERGVRRIGAEQEMFLVDEGWHPSPTALRLMERLDGPFATELALFNFEANVEPHLLEGPCFAALENRLEQLVGQVRRAASEFGARVVLTGILPTLSMSDLGLDNLTPSNRYRALNSALSSMRGGEPYKLRIEGADEINIQHDSVMLESCNTSFQVHLQVDPDDFAHVYNVAQVVTAPVMAAAVNSPLLFGKHLWHETRIALFQQSVDTRSGSVHMRDLVPRVRFGEGWIRDSVVELFQEDIARFRVLLTSEIDEDPLAVLDRGGVPKLKALQLYNSTVYRWNRPCYGVTDGKPHVRVECRVLPSGPTIRDEVANAAFWIGAVLGAAEDFGDVPGRIQFQDARANFLAAARHGPKAGFRWLDGRVVGARDLILEEMLPLAERGLASVGVTPSDVQGYLGVVRDRIEARVTGARWMLNSIQGMKQHSTRAEWLSALTAAMVSRQESGEPVHRWANARLEEGGGGILSYLRVEQFMTTTLFTVHEDELVDMVAFLMDRNQIRHVLVEDDAHQLVGIVSYRSVLRLMANGFDRQVEAAPAVKTIMERDPVTVRPETRTVDAIDLMRQQRVSCLPVVADGKLVGIVSERDFLPIAYDLLQERLRGT
jgi:CBS domain-containing protein